MGFLCILAAALLTLSGVNDTGKFLEETAKTFKMMEKSSNDKKDILKNDSKDDQKSLEVDKSVSSENLESSVVSDNSSLDSKYATNASSTSDIVNNEDTLSDKVSSLSNKYNKKILSPLRFPSQIQKNLAALIKPLAEFLSAGYVALGLKTRDATAFKWFDTLVGKPNEKLLGLE